MLEDDHARKTSVRVTTGPKGPRSPLREITSRPIQIFFTEIEN
jgi:hypothetical protein